MHSDYFVLFSLTLVSLVRVSQDTRGRIAWERQVKPSFPSCTFQDGGSDTMQVILRCMFFSEKSECSLSGTASRTLNHHRPLGGFPPIVSLWLVAPQVALVVKNLLANAEDRDASPIPGSGKFSGEEHGNPLQYSCLETSMDRGDWWAAVHRVTKSWT